jgi:hypothetical protein
MIKLDSNVIIFHKKGILFEKWELTPQTCIELESLFKQMNSRKRPAGEYTIFNGETKIIFNSITKAVNVYISGQPTIMLNKADTATIRRLMKEIKNV